MATFSNTHLIENGLVSITNNMGATRADHRDTYIDTDGTWWVVYHTATNTAPQIAYSTDQGVTWTVELIVDPVTTWSQLLTRGSIFGQAANGDMVFATAIEYAADTEYIKIYRRVSGAWVKQAQGPFTTGGNVDSLGRAAIYQHPDTGRWIIVSAYAPPVSLTYLVYWTSDDDMATWSSFNYMTGVAATSKVRPEAITGGALAIASRDGHRNIVMTTTVTVAASPWSRLMCFTAKNWGSGTPTVVLTEMHAEDNTASYFRQILYWMDDDTIGGSCRHKQTTSIYLFKITGVLDGTPVVTYLDSGSTESDYGPSGGYVDTVNGHIIRFMQSLTTHYGYIDRFDSTTFAFFSRESIDTGISPSAGERVYMLGHNVFADYGWQGHPMGGIETGVAFLNHDFSSIWVATSSDLTLKEAGDGAVDRLHTPAKWISPARWGRIG